MVNNILRSVAGNIQSTECMSIIMDECTDFRNREQVIQRYWIIAIDNTG